MRTLSGTSPGGHAARASEALFEESAWNLSAITSPVRRREASAASQVRLCSRPLM